jgi:hypothetical protein
MITAAKEKFDHERHGTLTWRSRQIVPGGIAPGILGTVGLPGILLSLLGKENVIWHIRLQTYRLNRNKDHDFCK